MLTLLLRRLAGAALVLLLVSFTVFALLDAAPGDAAQTLVGEAASADQVAAARRQLGLDLSVTARFARFAADAVLHGDLGRSVISRRPVGSLVTERFAYTLLLTGAAVSLALAGGLAVGLAAAARQGTFLDLVLMSASALGLSLPTYWVALLLTLVFSLQLGWLPVQGAGRAAHLVLPAVTLALPTAAVVARLVRASLLDVAQSDYVRTARAKGLPRRQLWQTHILRNGLMPVLTLVGLHLGHILGGTFIIETLFSWPGLGRLVVQAIFDRDFPVVVGGVILIAAIYQALNLLVDVAHALLDPRVGREAL